MIGGMTHEHSHADLPDAAHDLAVVTQMAGNPDQQDEFLQSAVLALGEALTVDHIAALLFRDGLLHLEATYPQTQAQRGTSFDPRKYPVFQTIIQSRNVQGIPYPHGKRDVTFLDEVDTSARLFVPILTIDKILGMLVVESQQTISDDPTVQYLARAYGHIIGNSLALAKNIQQLEIARNKLLDHNRILQADNEQDDDAQNIILEDTQHPNLKDLVDNAKKSAQSDVPILITGETGTGKEVLARQLHHWSERRHLPFVKINCAALPENLIESELFGHVKGAFSGALQDRAGRFAIADGGTLLLDEIGDLPMDMQAKLLRVLQEGTYQPVGSDQTEACNVRILASTNINLIQSIETGDFREDLYFRLNVIQLQLPPLRERRSDIPSLVKQILGNIHRRTGRGPWSVSDSNLAKLCEYDWPGNIRELVNVLERGRVLANNSGSIPIKLEHQSALKPKTDFTNKPWPTLKQQERSFIVDTLKRCNGKIYGKDGAAALLDMPPTTLSSRIQRLNIDVKSYR